MKNICITTLLLFLVTATNFAQQKGAYFWLGAGAGPSGLLYKWDGMTNPSTGEAFHGTDKIKWGGNAKLGFSYFFVKNVGLGIGLSANCFNSQGRYLRGYSKNEYINLGTQEADNIDATGDNHLYQLRARLIDWQENQHAITLGIPIMLQLQWKFGKKESWGIYFGAGVQFHIPLMSKYYVVDGRTEDNIRLNISGLLASSNIEYGLPNTPSQGTDWHGFGSVYNPNEILNWNGKIDMKASISGIANLGFIWSLTDNAELLTGVYIDYGFSNSKKYAQKDSPFLLKAPKKYSEPFYTTAGPTDKPVGTGIDYTGIINSKSVNEAHLLSYGIELTLRFKMNRKKDENTQRNANTDGFGGTGGSTIINNYNYYYGLGNDGGRDEYVGDGYVYSLMVMNDATKRPIPDAELRFGDNRVISNKDGYIEYEFPDKESMEAYVNSLGYKDVIYSIKVPRGNEKFVIDTIFMSVDQDRPIILHNIYYDFDKWDILPESKVELDKVVRFLKENPDKKIELSSHTDMRGSVDYNVKLSQRRANSAVAYIIGQGISGQRISAKGYGKSRPLYNCPTEASCTEQEHRANRRTEIYISNFGAAQNIPQTKGKF
ncbi:MAG: OmpA family protein [Bacteroidales bacterium]|nr:OmpA family protein [Bacteroidales bacterium]